MDRTISFMAAINQLGYGIVGSNLAASLAKKCKLSIFEIGSNNIKLNQYSAKSPSVKLWHQWDLFNHVGSLRVGFPIFELDRFTELEKASLLSQDIILVASNWAKNIVEDQTGHEHVRVVPLACDKNIFKSRPELGMDGNTTKFLNVGKWEVRKGHDFIIRAFCQAFDKNDKVELIMNCDNPCFSTKEEYIRYNNQWESYYMKYKPEMAHKITIISNRLETQYEVADLMNSVDCGIFPARAEGWNLDLFEMMSIGKPCITTNFSAHTEYVNKANALLIDIDKTESAYDGIWFKNQGNWAELGDAQLEQCVNHMRKIHLTKQQTGATLKLEPLDGYSWDLSANRILSYV